MDKKIYSLPWDEQDKMTDERICRLQEKLEDECLSSREGFFSFSCRPAEANWICENLDAHVEDVTEEFGWYDVSENHFLAIGRTKEALEKLLTELRLQDEEVKHGE